nr:restriction endonuclease [Hymenobacter pini]
MLLAWNNRLAKALAAEKSRLYKEYQSKTGELNIREKVLDQRTSELERLEKLLTEKSKSFPWLAGAIADLVLLNNNQVADYLAFKPRPAKSSALAVREVGKEKRILAAQLKHLQYVINQYEGLFPFLTEFREGEIEEALLEIKDTFGEQTAPEADPVTVFLTAGEYNSLSTTERNQRALERYMQGRKSPYQLGRDYERYVGYLYEREGYSVSYFGIENGKEDLGRDLICRKDGNTLIVQCKFWSKHKLIHEKHINQLFGTTVKFYLDSTQKKLADQQLHLFPQLLAASNISGVFCTSTVLSDTARKFAQALGIQVREQVKLGAFPMIKCHISPATGERIYHLPFDQMYDRTKLDKAGEFYALTVAEAEAKGFRRAWRWRG